MGNRGAIYRLKVVAALPWQYFQLDLSPGPGHALLARIQMFPRLLQKLQDLLQVGEQRIQVPQLKLEQIHLLCRDLRGRH